jgi:hypothetical protein
MFSIPSQDAVAIAQTYGIWIQTGAICLSAIAAIILIYWTKRVACRRATLDLIMSDETNSGQIEHRRKFIALREKGNLIQWLMPANVASDELATVRAMLNRYELVAIGIFEGSIDAKMYKRWCRTTYVADWLALRTFVMQLRHDTGNHKYFREYESLAKKWATKAERQKMGD